MSNQSVFATLGNNADHIGFWGEVASYDNPATTTDMGSGRFAEERWTRAAYIHSMRVQTGREDVRMTDFDGSAEIRVSDSHLYNLEAHFKSNTKWRSFMWLGGPGIG